MKNNVIHNISSIWNYLLQLNKVFAEDEALINKKLPKELLLRIFSYLDVVSLCRCAQVSKAWNILALDGSNWQRIDLFDFQRDVEVYIHILENWNGNRIIKFKLISGPNNRKHISEMRRLFTSALSQGMSVNSRRLNENTSSALPERRRFKFKRLQEVNRLQL